MQAQILHICMDWTAPSHTNGLREILEQIFTPVTLPDLTKITTTKQLSLLHNATSSINTKHPVK